MNYKVDKKSLFEMMEYVFNNIYKKDYVRYNNMTYEGYRLIENQIYKCELEKDVLTDSDRLPVISDEKIKKSIKKWGHFYINEKSYDFSTYTVNNDMNEIANLISPSVVKHPFLDFLPEIINVIATSKEEDIITFNEKDKNIILEILNEYKIVSEQEKTRGLSKIRKEIK